MLKRMKAISAVLVLIVLLPLFSQGITVQSRLDVDPEQLKEILKGSYSFDEAGWRVLHLEGDPYQIGFQYGYLLGKNISYNLEVTVFGAAGFYSEWENARKLSLEYWKKVPEEYQQEIRGIAEGVKASGAPSPFDRPIDWKDILALNAQVDLYYKQLSQEIKVKTSEKEELQPTEIAIKLETKRGCSAFVAAGNATKDGGVVIGHETWCSYIGADTNYFMINVKPTKGYEFSMQVMPGLIWSVEDWYMNRAGLAVAETTLGAGPYDDTGKPLFVRIREAVQYSYSIDDFVRRMTYKNNGAYSCDWLVADAKTGEIAILELGLDEWALKRTFNGFYGSCNIAWDEDVRKEQNAGEFTEDGSYARWVRWRELKEEWWGRVTPEAGKRMLSDHFDTKTRSINPNTTTLCGHEELDPHVNFKPHGSIDAKITDSSMMPRMEMLARRGHPCGMDFDASEFISKHPEYSKAKPYLKDMRAYEWTILGKKQ